MAGVDLNEHRSYTPEEEWKPYEEPPKQLFFQDLKEAAQKEAEMRNAEEEAARKAAEEASKVAKRHWGNLQKSFNKQLQVKKKRMDKLQGVIKNATEVKQLAFFERGKEYVQRMLAAAEKYEKDDITYSYRSTFKDLTQFGDMFAGLEALLETSLENNFVEQRTELTAVMRSATLRKAEVPEIDEAAEISEGRALVILKQGRVAGDLEGAYKHLVTASMARLEACVAMAAEQYRKILAEIRLLQADFDGSERAIKNYDEEMLTLACRIRSLTGLVRDHEDQRATVQKNFEQRQQKLEQNHLNKTRMISSLQKECKDSKLFTEELLSKIQSKLATRYRAHIPLMLKHHQRRRERDQRRAITHLDKRKEHLEQEIARLSPELRMMEAKKTLGLQACSVYTVRQHLVVARAMRIELLIRAAQLGASSREQGESTRDFGIKLEDTYTEEVGIDYIPDTFTGVAQMLAQELHLHERWLRERGQPWSYSRSTLELVESPSLSMPATFEDSVRKFLRQWKLKERVVHRFRTARTRRIGEVVRKAIQRLKQLQRIGRDLARRMAELVREEEQKHEKRILDLADESAIPMDVLKRCASSVSSVMKTSDLHIRDYHVEVLAKVRRRTLRSCSLMRQNNVNLAQVLQEIQGDAPHLEDHSEEIGEMSSIDDVVAALAAMHEAWTNDIAPRWGAWQQWHGVGPMVDRITELIEDAFAIAEIVEACAFWFLTDEATKTVGVFNDLLENQESWIPPIALAVARRVGHLQAVVQLCREAIDEGPAVIASTVTHINAFLETMIPLMTEEIHHGAEFWQLRMQECLRKQLKLHNSTHAALTWYYGAFFENSNPAAVDCGSSATGSLGMEDIKGRQRSGASDSPEAGIGFDRGTSPASFNGSFRYTRTSGDTAMNMRPAVLDFNSNSSDSGCSALTRGIEVLQGIVRAPQLRDTGVSGTLLAAEFSCLVHDALHKTLASDPEALEVALMGLSFMEDALRSTSECKGFKFPNDSDSEQANHNSRRESGETMRDTVRSFLAAAAAAEKEGGDEDRFLEIFDQEVVGEPTAEPAAAAESAAELADRLFFGDERRGAGTWNDVMVPAAAKYKGGVTAAAAAVSSSPASSPTGKGGASRELASSPSSAKPQGRLFKALRNVTAMAGKAGIKMSPSRQVSPGGRQEELKAFSRARRKALLAAADYNPSSPVLLEMAALMAAAAASQAAAAASAACAAAGRDSAAECALLATELAVDTTLYASDAVLLELSALGARHDGFARDDSFESMGTDQAVRAEEEEEAAECAELSTPSSSTRPPTGTTERGGELMSTRGSSALFSRSPLLTSADSRPGLTPSPKLKREGQKGTPEGGAPVKAEGETTPKSAKVTAESLVAAARSKRDRAAAVEAAPNIIRAIMEKLASQLEVQKAEAPSPRSPRSPRRKVTQERTKPGFQNRPQRKLVSDESDSRDKQQQQANVPQRKGPVDSSGPAAESGRQAQPDKEKEAPPSSMAKDTDGTATSTPSSTSHRATASVRTSILALPVAGLGLDLDPQASRKDDPSSTTSPNRARSTVFQGGLGSKEPGTSMEGGGPAPVPIAQRVPKRGLALAASVVRNITKKTLISKAQENSDASLPSASGPAAAGTLGLSVSAVAPMAGNAGVTDSLVAAEPLGVGGVSMENAPAPQLPRQIGAGPQSATASRSQAGAGPQSATATASRSQAGGGPQSATASRSQSGAGPQPATALRSQVTTEFSVAAARSKRDRAAAVEAISRRQLAKPGGPEEINHKAHRRASTLPPPRSTVKEATEEVMPKRASLEDALNISPRGALAQLPASWTAQPVQLPLPVQNKLQTAKEAALPSPQPAALPEDQAQGLLGQGVRFAVADVNKEPTTKARASKYKGGYVEHLMGNKHSFVALNHALEMKGARPAESGTSTGDEQSDGTDSGSPRSPSNPTPRQTLQMATKAQIGLKKLRKLMLLRSLKDARKEKSDTENSESGDAASASEAPQKELAAKGSAQGEGGAEWPTGRKGTTVLPATRDHPRLTNVNYIVAKMSKDRQAQANQAASSQSNSTALQIDQPPELDVRSMLLNSCPPLMVEKLLASADDTESLPTDVPEDDLLSIMGSDVTEYVKRESMASLAGMNPSGMAAWREKLAEREKKKVANVKVRASMLLPREVIRDNTRLDEDSKKQSRFPATEEGAASDDSEDGDRKSRSRGPQLRQTDLGFAASAAESKASRGQQRWQNIIRNDKHWNLRSDLQKIVKDSEVGWAKDLVTSAAADSAVDNYESPAWLAEMAGSSGGYGGSSASGKRRLKRPRVTAGGAAGDSGSHLAPRSFADVSIARGRASMGGAAAAIAHSEWGILALAADLGLGLAVSQNALAERSQGIARAGGLGLGLGLGEMAGEYRNHGVEVGFVMPGDNPRVIGTPGTRCLGLSKELSGGDVPGNVGAPGKILAGGPSAVWFPPVMSHKSPRASPTPRRRYLPGDGEPVSSNGHSSSCSSSSSSAAAVAAMMGGPLEKRRRKQALYHDKQYS